MAWTSSFMRFWDHTLTHNTRQNSSGLAIRPSQRPLCLTRHKHPGHWLDSKPLSQQASGLRARLEQRCHQNRLLVYALDLNDYILWCRHIIPDVTLTVSQLITTLTTKTYRAWTEQRLYQNCILMVTVLTGRPVFTHGPQGPRPRATNFQGRHIKKNRDWSMVCGKKKAVHEREI
jgi:hypothetical protein